MDHSTIVELDDLSELADQLAAPLLEDVSSESYDEEEDELVNCWKSIEWDDVLSYRTHKVGRGSLSKI